MEIIKAIVSKAASAGSVTKYGNVIEAIGENMKTDLSFKEMTAFIDYLAARYLFKYRIVYIERQRPISSQ